MSIRAVQAGNPATEYLRRLVLGGAGKAARAFSASVRAMQYGRMLSVMSALSDADLSRIGMTRADIPARAREAVYPPNRR